MKKKTKKKLIFILTVVLLILITILIIISNTKPSKYSKLVCNYEEDIIDGNMSVKYDIEYEENTIKNIKVTKSYTGITKEDKSNIATLKWIIEAENKSYYEYKGFKHKILRDIPKEYTFMYNLDMIIIDEELMKILNVYKNLDEQKEYLNNRNAVCK